MSEGDARRRSGTGEPADGERREEGFVRNDESKRARTAYSFGAAFASAAAGFAYAFASQRNMKIHLAVAVVAVVLGAAFRITIAEWLAVAICILSVFALECVNTAIESVVDLACPDYHDLARRAKDCAAAAVLVASGGAVVVEAVILLPRIAALLF